MKSTKLIIATIAITSLFSSTLYAQTSKPKSIDEIIESLTLEEKAGQLNLIEMAGEVTENDKKLIRKGLVGNVLKAVGVEHNKMIQKIAVEESRAGIPILFHEDVIHGYRVVSPIPLAEAASWDMDMIGRSAATAAREMTAGGVMLTYAPMVDVTRDPRWGRVLETSGEDPYLSSRVAEARVHGFQDGNSEAYHKGLACAKHYVGYGASLGGRDYIVHDTSERELREVHLPSFKAAVDAGVASLMSAYTMYDGVPAACNGFLLKDILRDEMGFEGTVITDYATINNLIKIGVCPDKATAAKEALEAGNDMDMVAKCFVNQLPRLVREGKIDEKILDDAVRRVLEMKQKIGILDDPYLFFDTEREQRELLSDKNCAVAKDMALKSMVLLKNDNKALPLKSKNIKKIAVIGPMLNERHDLMGWWAGHGRDNETKTIREAMEMKFAGRYDLSFSDGCKIDSFQMAGYELIAPAVKAAHKADMVIMVLGEHYWMSGEGGGTASLQLPGLQLELLDQVSKIGKPIVSVIVSGRPYILTDVAKKSDALIEAWMPGTMGAEALTDILAGDYNPSAKLPITFPLHEGQVPIYYSYKRSSHSFIGKPEGSRYTATYRDIPSRPLYPFGYGLSYTTFEYSDIEMSATSMTKDGTIEASVEVSNTGDVAGREVVQLYIGDLLCSVVRPEKELKDFAIVDLEPQQSKRVTFTITPDKLEFIGRDLKTTIESGDFNLYIGCDSQNVKSTVFTLE